MKKAVVLLSGGLDSTTTLFYALDCGYDCCCLIFDYGQKHIKEIDRAKKIAKLAKCGYYLIEFSLPWKGSSLVDSSRSIPCGKIQDIGKKIPDTYVPGRNTIFLSFAVSLAEATGAEKIFIGANAVDYSGYPDCRPGYYRIFNRLIGSGTKTGVEKKGRGISIVAPFINKSKSEIIKAGIKLKVPYEMTWSCYRGAGKPCMKCDSCVIRARGFEEAGIPDPLLKTRM